ncbi:MAG: feruloyl-CoA synthase [Comamonas sp. SCN 65-56]|uniref:feruloyl-CoA synthase n=1 Tax=Comamonas sp. SCN 65-56 TaxID=1660095 RepID=UPI00086CF39E|nr:feruloyl-CoA synthase [Comamonas sp. SCN 65-56]ODS93140.1 MAG: feruloyl-CoA synthase [Comamonas sp. SCN 65-56]
MSSPKFRPLTFGVTRVTVRDGDGGVQYLAAEQALQAFDARMSDALARWARETPDATFMAQRVRAADGSLGDWRHLSYGEALATARRIGQALLARGLSAERPVLILSENSLEHAQLALACLWVGVPWAPISPPYSLVSKDFGKLRHIMATLTPGLVWADDGARYASAIAATVPADCEVVLSRGADAPALSGRAITPWAELLATEATDAVDAAQAATGPDTILKFLFTSGSTKNPKAVINTHRMWCANQQQMRQSMPILTQEKPVLVDWLPWNHTFGGNHNVGMVLANGGTMYIDDGRPTPALVGETLRNLREIAPTLYFNVPTGFDAIAQAMKQDAQLRRKLLSRVKMFFYAGASLPQSVWDALTESEEAELGERIVMACGFGMTESSPYGLFPTSPNIRAGELGVPTPGMQCKLVPVDDKIELRYRGPNITPGYWRAPEDTAASFDEEGFFCTGDAVQWMHADDPHQGLRFDGRIAEDFKLATGTFVSVGPLRAKAIAAGAPYIQDVVVTGLNRNEVGALVFTTAAVRALAGLPADAPLAQVLAHPAVTARFQRVADDLAAHATGSASRIARLTLLAEPPSIDLGEVTDKGSINQRAVLKVRDALVQALYDEAPGVSVIKPGAKP